MADYTPPEIDLDDAEVIALGVDFGNRVGNGGAADIDTGLRSAMTDRQFRTETTGHEADTIVD